MAFHIPTFRITVLQKQLPPYLHIYQADLCGWVGQLGYGKESAFFANIYTAEEKEELEAVGFYATGENTSYQVYTVTDAEGSSQFGRRRKVASGEVANAGYYTVLLDKTMTLEAGERFAVIVEITTPGAIHPYQQSILGIHIPRIRFQTHIAVLLRLHALPGGTAVTDIAFTVA